MVMLINVSFHHSPSFQNRTEKIALRDSTLGKRDEHQCSFLVGDGFHKVKTNCFCSIYIGWGESAYQNDRGEKKEQGNYYRISI